MWENRRPTAAAREDSPKFWRFGTLQMAVTYGFTAEFQRISIGRLEAAIFPSRASWAAQRS